MLGLVILFPLLAHFPGNIKYLVYLFMIFWVVWTVLSSSRNLGTVHFPSYTGMLEKLL